MSEVGSAKGWGEGSAPPRRGRARRRLSRWQRRAVLAAFSVVFTLAALGALEGACGLAGYGGYPPTFREVGTLPDGRTLVFTDSDGPGSYFFARRSRAGSFDTSAFFKPKPPGVFRVFVVGGSAAKGSPYPQHLSAASFLREMLADVWPQRTVEVINLGTTAIASFPVLGIMTEALEYEPDLVVVYAGNNEYYGAYGVASLHTAGRSPPMMRLIRATRSTAIAQAIDRQLQAAPDESRTLMETIMGRAEIAPDDPAREAAARNLGRFVGEMVARCRARRVPVVVCTPPCNERGLAPLGGAVVSGTSEPQLAEIREALAWAAQVVESDPEGVASMMAGLTEQYPSLATAHHLLAKAFEQLGSDEEAKVEYTAAVDLDPMPWRPPRASVEAVRRAAVDRGAMLCDLQAAFREASPGGVIGWELMDDHVHPSLRGQALIARTIVETLARAGEGSVAVDQAALAPLPGWEKYAERLHVNEYDLYAAAHAMRLLGEIPFYRASNPQFLDRFAAVCARIEGAAPPRVVDELHAWLDPASHKGERRPITGTVGRVLYDLELYAEAEQAFAAAARSVTPYGSWELQYTYSGLMCRLSLPGGLREEDLRIAAEGIARGRVLLAVGESTTGAAERYMAELHLMRGERADAIPLLEDARLKLGGLDRVLADTSLVRACLAEGETGRAREVVEEGLGAPGEFEEQYRALQLELPER